MLANMRWRNLACLIRLRLNDILRFAGKVWGCMTTKQLSRQRVRRLRVLVLPDEEEAIKANAEHCGLSVSAYLRKLGCNYFPKSVLDYRAVVELSKLNADQGRLGGLLKMWLSNDERFEGGQVSRVDVQRLFQDLTANQRALSDTVKKL